MYFRQSYALILLPLALIAVLFLLPRSTTTSSQTTPIRPKAQGWGALTYGGSGRNNNPPNAQAIKVTNLNDSGSGSLRACVEAEGPRTCVFEVGGWLPLASNMPVRNPYLTIAGATAPAPGIHIRNAELHIFTHDVFIEHIYSRAGDDVTTGGPISSRHCITVAGDDSGAYRVFIGHFSGSWSVATCFNTWYAGNHDISLQDSIIAEPLDDSFFGGYPPYNKHQESTNSLVGYNTKKLSLIGNLLAHGRTRFPLIKSDTSGEFVNNLVFGWGNKDGIPNAQDGPWYVTEVSDYQDCPDGWCNGFNGLPSFWDFDSNIYRADSESVPNLRGIYNSPDGASHPDSRYFIKGNIDGVKTDSTMEDWESYEGPNANNYKSNTPVSRSPGLVAISADTAFEHVLYNAGARSKDNDPIDRRIKDDAREQRAREINCVTDTPAEGGSSTRCDAPYNAGGWYSLQTTHRALQLPSNLNTVRADGYTELEHFNFDAEREVEGDEQLPAATPIPTPLPDDLKSGTVHFEGCKSVTVEP